MDTQTAYRFLRSSEADVVAVQRYRCGGQFSISGVLVSYRPSLRAPPQRHGTACSSESRPAPRCSPFEPLNVELFVGSKH